MPIRVLPAEISNKIAAGEVVERPASVAKELLENAIDAGATEVRIEIEQGGRRLLRVSDNGCGIPAAEADLAFERHATSKLERIEDLYRVRTLGFRGEALASIAAVARVTLSTRARDEEVGTLIRLEGAQLAHRQPTARPPGTTLTVENLFFNTPARLKFMRADATEASHVARLATSYALAYPELRFQLENNGRLLLRTLGTGQLGEVLVSLYGLDVAEQMIELPRPSSADDGLVMVWGYVGGPALHRANRQELIFFVNRRWVQDSALAYAVSEAYRTLLPAGRYPMVVLNIEVPPEEVDVNIHPTKREVRFRQAHGVFVAVQRAVRGLLMAQRPVPAIQAPRSTGLVWERPGLPGLVYGPGLAHGVGTAPSPVDVEVRRTPDAPEAAAPAQDAPPERLPMLRVVGQIAQAFVVAEGPGGMYLIDQHAAHERVRYEELQAQRAAQGEVTQELLEPLMVEFDPAQAAQLEQHLDTLCELGLVVEPFGGTTFLVRRAPASLAGGADIGAAIAELLDAALQGGPEFAWEEQALITLSCHTAIRAGQTLSVPEMRDLIRQLERSQLPHTCPHGRPTMLHLSHAQLEREFGRR
ncbi:MAG: DNA mismatch repair endonuclease MutL [Chloroflexota bacterium]